MENNLGTYLKARRPIIWINNGDYKEVDTMINNAIKIYNKMSIFEYRAFGLVDFETKEKINSEIDLYNLMETIFKEGYEQEVILIIKDSKEIEIPQNIAYMKRIAEKVYNDRTYNFNIIIVNEEVKVPKELEKFISIMDIENMDEIKIIQYIKDFVKKNNARINKDDLGDLAISLKGLTKIELDHILNVILEKNHNSISKGANQLIIREKGQIIKKSSILEIIDFKEQIADIGGLEALKEWLSNKAKILRNLDNAKKFGVDTPKGVLLVGMPGCGKSLAAKASARLFNVPLLRLDIGRLLGKYVGESEHNMRRALKTAESISPCVLWIDEIEKAFAGVGKNESSGASDVTKRLFGQFLTWLQEKENTVFVVATANDISMFPPEFLRKGRFDEVFFIDFPNEYERQKIFEIHLEKRGQQLLEIDLEKVVSKTNGYCGSDIEEVVKSAIEKRFLTKPEKKDVTTEDLLEAVGKIDSLSNILKEQIKELKKVYEKFKLKSATTTNVKKSKLKDMVIVNGGKYKPSFCNEEIRVTDLEVGKYEVTQDLYIEIMGKNPSHFKGEKLPVGNVEWIETLKFCNGLSKKYDLEPVYIIENDKLVAIQEKNGVKNHPSQADFKNTSGYRLPTEVEWEWFASGGEIARQDNPDLKYEKITDGNNPVAWIYQNKVNYYYCRTHTVGMKKSNELGLYDCIGNVLEYCFDTDGGGYISDENEYIFHDNISEHVVKGGKFFFDYYGDFRDTYFSIDARSWWGHYKYNCHIGFRVVRSV